MPRRSQAEQRERHRSAQLIESAREQTGWDPTILPPGAPPEVTCPPGYVQHPIGEPCTMDGVLCNRCGTPRTKDCCNGNTKGVQFFSSWLADPNNDPSTPALQTYRILESPYVPHAIRWTAALWGWETQAVALAVNGGPIGATDPSAIQFGDPDLHNTFLKARIGWQTASGGTIRDVDISRGVRFSVEACKVVIDILYPVEGHVNPFAGNPTAAPTLTGLVLNSIIGAWIAPIQSVPGRQILTNTETLRIAADAVGAMIPPPGAIELSLYQSAQGQILTPHWSVRTDDAYGSAVDLQIQAGEVILGADRRADRVIVPGNAKQLLLGAVDVDDNRNVTAVWGLEM
jgi:hypothetical protein